MPPYAGNESKPASPKADQAFSNYLVSPQEQMQRIIPLLFPTNWLKANPDYLPIPKELVSLDVMGKQANAR
jgi:hypothetical protein